jgi:hypothetical protein
LSYSTVLPDEASYLSGDVEKRHIMPTAQSQPWFHSNRYAADASCDFCGAVIRHEAWCIARNPQVQNAWEAILDSAKLSLHDHLILHALGVSWKGLPLQTT